MASNLSYEDQLLEERDTAVSELETSYDTKIEDGKTHYSNLQDAVQQQADKQAEIQQANTDFAIETIEQHKAQTEKDYIKEQSAAYADWKKQSNPYGAEAEKMASYGLEGTGYSESSQVAMYNNYQKRLTATREALDQAKLVYDNNIKEAILQNNAALAEIYANAYVSQMQMALEGFNYQNALLSELESKKAAINSSYLSALQQFQEQNTPEDESDSVVVDQDAETEKTSSNNTSSSLVRFLQNIKTPRNLYTLAKLNSAKTAVDVYPDVDMGSLVKLGYGMITPKAAAELVEKGEVKLAYKIDDNGRVIAFFQRQTYENAYQDAYNQAYKDVMGAFYKQQIQQQAGINGGTQFVPIVPAEQNGRIKDGDISDVFRFYDE